MTLGSLVPKTQVYFYGITLPGKAQQFTLDSYQKVEFHLPILQLSFGQLNIY
jgi:hypothetical protein